MPPTEIESFYKLLQMSLLPGVLISGAALLLLSITNRLGRTVDRSRSLASELENGQAPGREAMRAQLRILFHRARILRTSTWFVAVSIFLSSLIVLGLFLMLFLGWAVQSLVLIGFFSSVVALIFSVVCFMLDTSLALKAVRLDVQPHL